MCALGMGARSGAAAARLLPVSVSLSLSPPVTQVARRRSPPCARRSDAHPRSLAGPPLLLAFFAAALDPRSGNPPPLWPGPHARPAAFGSLFSCGKCGRREVVVCPGRVLAVLGEQAPRRQLLQ